MARKRKQSQASAAQSAATIAGGTEPADADDAPIGTIAEAPVTKGATC